MVAIPDGPGGDCGHVAAGTRLGPCLCPDDLSARHGGEKSFLLFFGAELHDRGAKQEDAVLVGAVRPACAEILFLKNQPLNEVKSAPAIGFGPGDHAPVTGCQRALPRDMLLISFPTFERHQRRPRHMRFHPRPDLGAECILLG